MVALLTGTRATLQMIDRLRVYFNYWIEVPSGDARNNLQNSLVDFYVFILKTLANAIQFLEKNTAARFLAAVWTDAAFEQVDVECRRLVQRLEADASNCDREFQKQDRNVAKQHQFCLKEALRHLDQLSSITYRM